MPEGEIIFGGPVPLYIQLADLLRDRITGGQIRVGRPIPSKRALMAETGVGEHTVDKAVAILRREGLVRTTAGLGIFVISDQPER